MLKKLIVFLDYLRWLSAAHPPASPSQPFSEYIMPVDSGFWWLLILRAYRTISGDQALVDSQAIQVAIRKILELCLTTR